MTGTPDWTGKTRAFWEQLAAEHGTPFFLFDAEHVRGRIRAVREAVGGLAGVYYAVKANPNLGLLKALRADVDGVDISSSGELAQCLHAGYDPEAMSFAGPGKTGAEIDSAVRTGIKCVSVESMREIDACADAAQRIGRPASILLRINPATVHKAYGLKMGGRSVQFGIDEEALPDAVKRVQSHGNWLDCEGVHTYVGSQCFDGEAVVETMRQSFALAGRLEELLGRACRKVNLGGGFGVAQSGDHRELRLADIAGRLHGLTLDFLRSRPSAGVFFELGRYVLAGAGVYVTRVVDAKDSRGTRFLVCDGGLNHQLAAAGTFGAALRGNFPSYNLSRADVTQERVNIAGPSCNPTDLLSVQCTLPRSQIGDLIGIGMSGSYGLTASPLLFLGHESPAELVMDGAAITVGRCRHSVLEFN